MKLYKHFPDWLETEVDLNEVRTQDPILKSKAQGDFSLLAQIGAAKKGEFSARRAVSENLFSLLMEGADMAGKRTMGDIDFGALAPYTMAIIRPQGRKIAEDAEESWGRVVQLEVRRIRRGICKLVANTLLSALDEPAMREYLCDNADQFEAEHRARIWRQYLAVRYRDQLPDPRNARPGQFFQLIEELGMKETTRLERKNLNPYRVARWFLKKEGMYSNQSLAADRKDQSFDCLIEEIDQRLPQSSDQPLSALLEVDQVVRLSDDFSLRIAVVTQEMVKTSVLTVPDEPWIEGLEAGASITFHPTGKSGHWSRGFGSPALSLVREASRIEVWEYARPAQIIVGD